MEVIMYVYRNLAKFQSYGEVNLYQRRNANKLFIPHFTLAQAKKVPLSDH